MQLLVVGIEEQLRSRIDGAPFKGMSLRYLDEPPLSRSAAAEATDGVDVVICALPRVTGGDSDAALLAASCGVYNLITTASSASRFILISSLSPFERYPLDYQVTEYWAPWPTTEVEDLIAMTAEGVVREVAHVLPLKALCLRVGTIVDDGAPPDSRAVHVDDVVQALSRALTFEAEPGQPTAGWWVFHIVGAGRTRFPLGLAAVPGTYPNGGRGSTLGYEPHHDVTGGRSLAEAAGHQAVEKVVATSDVPAKRIVIFGAGGPFGAVAAESLEKDHVLRLTDAKPLAEIVRSREPRGSEPAMRMYGPPHETAIVDVTDFEQVFAATREMDAILNLTVVRDDPVQAFRVNTIGALNVAKAAVRAGIRRLVMTGPNQVFDPMPGAYWSDFHLGSDVPQRPGTHLYMLSKFLGNEIVRVFAEEHGLEVPDLVYGYLIGEADCQPDPLGGHPFMVSWADTGRSMRCALDARSFPRPFEVFHIQGDLPHGKYRNERAKEVLGWQPRDSLAAIWRRELTPGTARVLR